MAPVALSPATLQRLHLTPTSAAALRTISGSSLSPSASESARCVLAASVSTSGSCFKCEAGHGEGLGFRVLDARGVHRAGTISSFSASASESARCDAGAGSAGFASGSCLRYEVGGVGLGFRVLDGKGVNKASAISSSSLSVPASESVRSNVGAGGDGFGSGGDGFGSGSCCRCEARGVGLGFRVGDARGLVTGCLGRMDSSVGVGLDEDRVTAFGVVVPAREEIYSEAVRALGSGHVVAVPTDTLYGLACDANSGEAIRRVYEIKGRKLSSPLAVCVADVDVVGAYGETSHLPAGLLNALLPGAVTLVLPRRENGLLSADLNPGVGSIGIRIPDSDFIRGLSRSFGGALALTSANSSGDASTVRVEEFEHLWPHCAFVFDAGTLPGEERGRPLLILRRKVCSRWFALAVCY